MRARLWIACTATFLLSACGAGTALHDKGAATRPDTAASRVPIEQLDSQFLYLAAQNAIQEGDVELAIRFLDTLVKKDSEAVAPRLQLVRLLVMRRKHEQALKHLEPLLARTDLTDRQNKEVRILHAQALAASGRRTAALEELTRLLQQTPENLAIRTMKVRLLAEAGQIDEALDVLNAGIRIADNAELRLMQAQLFMRRKNTAGAVQALKKMQKLAPDDERPVLMMSQLAKQQKDRARAEELLRDYLAGHPLALRVSNALGRLLVEDGRVAEAITIYRRLANQTGGEPEVLNALGLLYYQHKDYKQAADAFRQSYEKRPTDQSRFYLATSLEALEKESEAAGLYRQIKPDRPFYVDAQLRLAGLEYRHENYTAAATRVKKIIAKRPDTADAYLLLSGIRLVQQRYRLLLKETQPALALRRIPPRLLFNRAVAFESLKDHEQVETTLKQLLKTDPKNAEALNFLGYAYAEQGIKLDEAESLIRRALDIKPDDGYYLDSLAWVYFRRGRFEEALKYQKKALQAVADDPVMHEHMGDILWKGGDHEKARSHWRRAIELKHNKPDMLRRKIKKGL